MGRRLLDIGWLLPVDRVLRGEVVGADGVVTRVQATPVPGPDGRIEKWMLTCTEADPDAPRVRRDLL